MSNIHTLKDFKDKIDYLYHISDVHINLQKRHQEFREVFEKLYDQLRQFKNNKEKGLIVLTGDILNSKNIMTPELIVLVQEFFSELSIIFPVIMIAGNHDAILNNSDRMDSLTPLVFSQSQPQKKLTSYQSDKYDDFYYLRESGLYKYNNIIFSVASVFDSKIIPAKSITENPNDLKIALHHGTLDGSKTDLGHVLTSSITIKDFQDYDAVLLGDIHKYQSLDAQKKVFYAGSLIQLNHGESINYHGLLKWDISQPSNIKTQFYEIPNNYGFCTITIRNNKIIKQPTKIPLKPRIRYRIDQLTSDQKFADIKQYFRQNYQVQEEIVDNLSIWGEALTDENQVEEDKDTEIDLTKQSQLAIDILNPDVQKQLIVDYFKEQEVSEDVLKQLIDLNKKLNDEATANDNQNIESSVIHNSNGQLKWKIKRLSFSNMFNYGENNVIDFTQLSQICGIFGENGIGKSSILDIILFVLFDKCSRGERTDVLNLSKSKFDCELIFNIGNNTYKITRTGGKYTKTISGKKKTSVRIDVVFEQMLSDGSVINLTGQDRNETNKKIREMIGTYEDFVMSTFLLQKGDDKFLKMSQADQKTLLYDLFKLNWFDKLYHLAKSKMDYYNYKIKDLEKLKISETISKEKNELETIHSQLKPLMHEMSLSETKILNIDNEISNIRDKMIAIQQTDLSLQEVEEQINSIQVKKDKLAVESDSIHKLIDLYQKDPSHTQSQQQLKLNISNHESIIKEKEIGIANLSSKIIKVKNFNLEKYQNNLTHIKNLIEQKQQSIADCEIQIKSLNKQMDILQTQITKCTNISVLNKKKSQLIKNKDEISKKINLLYSDKKPVKNKINDSESVNQQLSFAKQELQNLMLESQSLKSRQIEYKDQLEKLKQEMIEYNQLLEKKTQIVKDIEKFTYQIANIHSSSEKLLRLEYDPNCRYCTNNIFVIEARQCSNHLEQLQKQLTDDEQSRIIIESRLNQLQTPDNIQSISGALNKLVQEELINNQKIEKIKIRINEIEEDIINHEFNSGIDNEINQLKANINKINTEIEEIQKRIDDNNQLTIQMNDLKEKSSDFLISKLNLQQELDTHQLKSTELQNNYNITVNNQKYAEQISIIQNEVDILYSELNQLKKQEDDLFEYSKSLLNRLQITSEIEKLNDKLSILEAQLSIHNKNDEIIQSNSNLELMIKNLQLEKGRYSLKLLSLKKRKEKIIISKTILKTTIEQYEKQNEELQQIKNDVTIYQLYCQCLGKNGLPYYLLMKIINIITEISNNLLKQIADFTIQFVEDNDKKKLSLLLHRKGQTQSTAMTSGFEEFIIELSLKIAFSMVSNVTRPNFLAIDEGFGCLDSDHLNSLISILNFIKTKFDFILIITHVNELKGQGDYYIDIKKLPNGDSNVNNSKLQLPQKKITLRNTKLTLKKPTLLSLKN